jgi:hypothetical protein
MKSSKHLFLLVLMACWIRSACGEQQNIVKSGRNLTNASTIHCRHVLLALLISLLAVDSYMARPRRGISIPQMLGPCQTVDGNELFAR